jgi:hypothetical protein
MKKGLLLLIFVPILTFGQSKESIAAFLKSRPEGLGTAVSLPETSYNPNYRKYDTTGKKHSIIYVVTTDSVYHEFFSMYRFTKESLEQYKMNNDSLLYKFYSRYLIDSLPVFDFSKQELVLYAACGQCFAFCGHHGEEQEPCHRNACHYLETWYVRDKEPLYVKETK